MRKIVLCLLLAVPTVSFAQGYTANRADTWEFSIAGIFQDGWKETGMGGSSLEIDDEWGFGFDFGYNFSDHLFLGLDLDFIRPDFEATLVDQIDPTNTQQVKWTASQFNSRLKGRWNITQGPFVPYIELGIGWTYLDSNVADGPPTTGCWWHPWYGPICTNYFDTYSGSDMTYGGGIGVRYEMRGGSFINLSYNSWIYDTDSDISDPSMDYARLEYGWSF